ncbi:MAG: hypothetical protein ACLGG0_10610 [Bacteriovoracia bacterium]
MKNFIIIALILTSFVSYSQDAAVESTIAAPYVEEDLSPTDLDPLAGTSADTVDPAVEMAVDEANAKEEVETLTPEAIAPEAIAPEAITETTPEEAPIPEVIVEEKPIPRKTDTAFAVRGIAPQSVQELDDDESFKHRKSNWVSSFGFEHTRVELPYEFQGAKKQIGEEKRELMGARLGLGRDFYVGSGFIFGTRLEGYYLGTLFTDAQTADPELDIEVAATKKSGHIFGADAIAHLGWMFDFKTKNPFLGDMTYMAFELFVEAGIGRGKGYNRKEYYFDASPVTDEEYSLIIEDDFTSQVISAGFNILSTSTGAFLYVKGSQVTQDITERKFRGMSRLTGQAEVDLEGTVKNPDVDPITIVSIGGGFRF